MIKRRYKIRKCSICAISFQPTNGCQKYCSPPCAATANKEMSLKYRQENLDHCRQKNREYYYANRDRALKRQKKHYKANRDRMRAWHRAYNQSPKGKKAQQAYLEANKEQILERRRKWWAKNRERINKKGRKRHAANRERNIERSRKYWKKNGDALRAKARERARLASIALQACKELGII